MSSRTKGLWARGTRWWARWTDEHGEHQRKPLARPDGSDDGQPLIVGQDDDEAAAAVAAIKREVKAAKRRQAAAIQPDGPLTVQRWQRLWTDGRKKHVPSAVDDDSRFAHAFPILVGDPPTPFGDLELVKVRQKHCRRVIYELKKRIGHDKADLGSRTVRNIAAACQALFRDAMAEEKIPATPWALIKGDLPPKLDKDPGAREEAVFTCPEVERLISDDRLEPWHRVLWAFLFLTGMRIGEASACRWGYYDPSAEPLGKIVIKKSWSHRHKREKPPKTGIARQVPVHPTLAKVLAQWKLSGWQQHHGRQPTDDDRILPAVEGGYLLPQGALKMLRSDLKKVGLRRRKTHDTRATFISLGLEHGANEPLLKKVTHLSKQDAFDFYKRTPFPALCAEVAKLRVSLVSQASVIPMARVASGGEVSHSASTTATGDEKGPELQEVRGPGKARGTGLEYIRMALPDESVSHDASHSAGVRGQSRTTPHVGAVGCANVPNGSPRALLEAAAALLERGDGAVPAEALAYVRAALRALEGGG